jgi:hypothetical protein
MRVALAFTDLLALGFATIGVRATLAAISSQLLSDALPRSRPRHAPEAA